MVYLCHRICSVYGNTNPGISSFIYGFFTGFVTRVKRRELPVEQDMPTLPDHPSSPPIFSGVHIARSLVLCVVFCKSLFVLLSFFCWPLCCLSFELWLLTTPLVSSHSANCPVKTIAMHGKCVWGGHQGGSPCQWSKVVFGSHILFLKLVFLLQLRWTFDPRHPVILTSISTTLNLQYPNNVAQHI